LPVSALAAQNGLGQPRPVIACFFALDRDDAGIVRTVGPPPRVVLADPGPSWTEVLARWSAAGITVELAADPRPAQWEKAILNATVGPLCLATGLGMAAVWDDGALRDLVSRATAEGGRIAGACSIAIPSGLVERASVFFASVGAHRPSVLRDAGELPWIIGHLRAQAAIHRVACPALDEIDRLVSGRSPRLAAHPQGVAGGSG
jgi:2-dehydropantoate 2-reductase